MGDAVLLARLEDTSETAVTTHALERGYDQDELEDRAAALDGVIYWDTEQDCYHLVAEDVIIVMRLQFDTRLVLTAYPNDETPRYHDPRYTLVRG